MNIVLFDGVCNLCNSTILFLIKHDTNHNFHFAATQTESGKNLMRQYNILDEEKSVFFIKDGIVFSKSNAVIEIAKQITGWPQIFKYGNLFPAFIRDGVYNLIAKNRYALMGTRDSCSVPSKDHIERFLL
jgi:predicted DCC family thiol-disulfide oxidoreductase YuxK